MSLLGKLIPHFDRQQRAIEEYNLGFHAKYAGDWEKSLFHNQRAAELNPEDEATWWNLGIAPTALHNWPEARRAWLACGVKLQPGEGEVAMPELMGCLRIDPSGRGEVVWGRRIDPARIRVLNVPLPESERRYGDILLNDGAQERTRTANGQEYPVMNELALWQLSPYSTFAVQVTFQSSLAKDSLQRICEENDLAFEDWGRIRRLCATCSRGNPGEHVCLATEVPEGSSRFGFAAQSLDVLRDALREWMVIEEDLAISKIDLVATGLSD